MFALLLSITAVAVTITLSLTALYSYCADVKKESCTGWTFRQDNSNIIKNQL